MGTYRVHTRFVISGTFEVNASSEADAQKKVRRFCGISAAWNPYSTLPERVSYRFSRYPVKEITQVTIKRKRQ